MDEISQPGVGCVVKETVALFKDCQPDMVDLSDRLEGPRFDWIDKCHLIQHLEQQLGLEIGVHLGDINLEFPKTVADLIALIVKLTPTPATPA